jgi:hypothetical protein
MTDIAHLESVAQQLAAGVRYETVEENTRWLQAQLPDPRDWFRLCFVLAAAVPDDRTWAQLTSWWTGYDGRRLLRPHGTAAAVRRHNYRNEHLCEPCKAWDRNRKRATRQRARTDHDNVTPSDQGVAA